MIKSPLKIAKTDLEKIELIPFSVIDAGKFSGSYSKHKCREHPLENLTGDHLRLHHKYEEDRWTSLNFHQLVISTIEETDGITLTQKVRTLEEYLNRRKTLIQEEKSRNQNSKKEEMPKSKEETKKN